MSDGSGNPTPTKIQSLTDDEDMNQKIIQSVLHIITALGFAWSVAVFVHHYDLIEFAGAPVLSFVFVFFGYWFLSHKYDPSLTIIFLVVAIFVFYRAATLPEKKIVEEPFEKVAAQKLSVLTSLVEEYRIRTGNLPKDLHEWKITDVQNVFYCVRSDCDPKLTKENPSLYFIGMEDMYIDDSFKIGKGHL